MQKYATNQRNPLPEIPDPQFVCSRGFDPGLRGNERFCLSRVSKLNACRNEPVGCIVKCFISALLEPVRDNLLKTETVRTLNIRICGSGSHYHIRIVYPCKIHNTLIINRV